MLEGAKYRGGKDKTKSRHETEGAKKKNINHLNGVPRAARLEGDRARVPGYGNGHEHGYHRSLVQRRGYDHGSKDAAAAAALHMDRVQPSQGQEDSWAWATTAKTCREGPGGARSLGSTGSSLCQWTAA